MSGTLPPSGFYSHPFRDPDVFRGGSGSAGSAVDRGRSDHRFNSPKSIGVGIKAPNDFRSHRPDFKECKLAQSGRIPLLFFSFRPHSDSLLSSAFAIVGPVRVSPVLKYFCGRSTTKKWP